MTTAAECALLTDFREFVQRLREQRQEDEAKTVVTRDNNDRYPLETDELQAEIRMAIWKHMQAKRYPHHFQLALLREVEKEAAKLQYRSVKDYSPLQMFVSNRLEQLLIRITDNAQANQLKNYADAGSLCAEADKCACISASSTATFVVGDVKNFRRKMEDRHTCLERYSELYELQRPYSLYAVFDGHSGPLAASYAACHLPYLLAEHLRQLPDNTVPAYREAFEACFLRTDEMFSRKCIFSGTTAVCVLLEHANSTTSVATTPTAPTQLYVAWVGDSKALLVSPTVSLQLVKPHKPDVLEERKRIELNGRVMYSMGHWRVNGVLSVSRAIGDFSMGAIIAEPDFVDVSLSGAQDFIVLGTDGLWDYVEENTLVETIYNALADATYKVEDIPKLLIEQAKQGDSRDNITVVIVWLKERNKIVENYKSSSL